MEHEAPMLDFTSTDGVRVVVFEEKRGVLTVGVGAWRSHHFGDATWSADAWMKLGPAKRKALKGVL